MKTVPLGHSGLRVSTACLGTMRFGTATDEATSFRILDMYAGAGGTFLDTANVYASWEPNGEGGDSEALLGRWMRARGNRGEIFLATKLGSRYQETGLGLRAGQIQRECEDSLRRLGVETIDLYYAHFDDRTTPLQETMLAFNRLIQAGKVRLIGASNFRAWRLERIRAACQQNAWPAYCCVQQRYSYLQPAIGALFGLQAAANEDLLEYCRETDLTLLAYSPLLGGSYAREDKPVPQQYAGPHNELRLQALRAVAEEMGASPNQIVLAWMLHGDPVAVPIIAASTPQQMEENLAALEISLGAEEMERLNSAA
jgi:aryl-alcohol dehydrogenase-like predicted oxidoreductase